MRRFYAANADARTTTSRSNLSNSTLTGADSHALRRAIRSLGSFTYDDDNETNIKNNVSAFISTYNNMINSSGASDDRTMKNTQKSLKNLTAEYESQLDKIGITVKDNGTLESRSSLFSSADISKFESLFSSDSEYMQRVNSYARRLENRSNILPFCYINVLCFNFHWSNRFSNALLHFRNRLGSLPFCNPGERHIN